MNSVASDLDNLVSYSADPMAEVSGAPIFLTGFARSGTTLFNRLMRDYFDAGFVNEGQFIVTFGKHIQRYGDLRVARNLEKLVHDLAGDEFFPILKRNYRVEINWNRIAETSKSFSEIVKHVLTQIAEQTDTHRIGSKYPVFGWHLGLLNDLFPDCRVIHVIRDGRDCALSHKKVTWGHQNTYCTAVQWRKYIQAARQGSKAMRDRYLEIRYEDLLVDPKTIMQTLERFITGTHEYSITERFLVDGALLKTDRVGRWRQAMPIRSQAIFESVAGDTLECCGYPLTGLIREPSFLPRVGYVVHDRLAREGWNIARKIFKNISEYK